MGKTLTAYFSASGVTGRVAEEIAEAAGADLYEIRPAKPYTAADLDWTDSKSRSTIDMGQYDTIFLGFPIWWYVEPRIVDTFLESYDFSGKTVIPFATSGGSGIGKAEKSLQAHCPGADWKKGQLLNGSGAGAWARSMLGV